MNISFFIINSLFWLVFEAVWRRNIFFLFWCETEKTAQKCVCGYGTAKFYKFINTLLYNFFCTHIFMVCFWWYINICPVFVNYFLIKSQSFQWFYSGKTFDLSIIIQSIIPKISIKKSFQILNSRCFSDNKFSAVVYTYPYTSYRINYLSKNFCIWNFEIDSGATKKNGSIFSHKKTLKFKQRKFSQNIIERKNI